MLKRMLCLILIVVSSSTLASWNIATKGRAQGPAIHTTYFLTPNNAAFPVHAVAYVGSYINGNCQYNAVYDLGTETLRTGDFVDIDAFQLKSVIGVYKCMTINYTSRQVVMESMQLIFDGVNYQTSLPATSEVTIL